MRSLQTHAKEGRKQPDVLHVVQVSHRILMCTKKEWAFGALGLGESEKTSCWEGGEAGQAGAHMLYDAVYAAVEKIQMKLE